MTEGCDPEWERFVGMLSIPYFNVVGDVTSIRFRTIHPDDTRAKYLQPAGSDITIYNMPALRRVSDTIIITEGEIDCLSLEAQGYTAIGLPGAHSWKPHYAKALEGFRNVIAWGDPDDAGQEFNEKIIATIRRAVPARMKADINDTMQAPMGFAEIAEAYERAGGKN